MAQATSNLTPDQAATVQYISGLNADGTLADASGWQWDGKTPAGYVNGFESAHKFGGDTAGTPSGTVLYYFDPGSSWTTAEEGSFVSAMTLWSDEANITFAQTNDPSTAQISFYRYGTTTPGVTLDNGAYALPNYTPGQTDDGSVPTTQHVTLSFETTGFWSDLASFTANGGYGPSTVVHELGHALGLAHAGPYNGTVVPATQQYNATDTYLWTTMSYIDPSDATAKYYNSYPLQGTSWGSILSPATPQMLDILAMQRIYGTPTSTGLSGDQVFGFNTNITDASRPFFDFTQNTSPVVTLWDAGTGNTLDLSGSYLPSTVNLNPGTFSSAMGMVNNIGIAFGTKIDTAVGGRGDDTFVVNTDDDAINGGGGSNMVVLPDAAAAYQANYASGTITLHDTSGNGATDRLTDIQTLQFADGRQQASEMSFIDGHLIQDDSDPAGTVYLLYNAVWGKAPDADSLGYWAGRLQSGSASVHDVASALLASPTGQSELGARDDPTFVQELYRTVLNRAPTSSEQSYWQGQLSSGALDRAGALLGFAQGQELRGIVAQRAGGDLNIWVPDEQAASVARLYHTLLDRAPDLGGLAYWTGQLRSGTETLMQEAQAILGSAEYGANAASTDQAFVSQLYTDALGRTPDASGASYWTNLLDTGTASRAFAAVAFSDSSEAHTALAAVTLNDGIHLSA